MTSAHKLKKSLIDKDHGGLDTTNMPHRVIPIIELITWGFAGMFTSIIGFVIWAEERLTNDISELRGLLVPLLGGALMVVCLILFRIRKEPPNVTCGRAGFSLMLGSAANIILSLILPVGKELILHPIMMLIGGAIVTGFFFIVSLSLIKKVYKKSDSYAESILTEAEKRITDKLNKEKDENETN